MRPREKAPGAHSGSTAACSGDALKVGMPRRTRESVRPIFNFQFSVLSFQSFCPLSPGNFIPPSGCHDFGSGSPLAPSTSFHAPPPPALRCGPLPFPAPCF